MVALRAGLTILPFRSTSNPIQKFLPRTRDSSKEVSASDNSRTNLIMDGRIIVLEERVLRKINHKWDIERMAASIGISESYLQRLFKNETGFSPIQYIREIRLKYSKKLLEDRCFLRIQEICREIGINDQSHFTRDFKKRYGVTPTQYRRNYWLIYQSKNGHGNGLETRVKIRGIS